MTTGADPVRLPEPVRRRVLAVAAAALDGLEPAEVPAALRAVARFTPAKRARVGAGPLAAVVETDEVFRRTVAERFRAEAPELAAALAAGTVPAAVPPEELAAAAYLLRPKGWTELVERAAGELSRGREQAVDADRDRELAALRDRLAAVEEVAREQAEQVEAAAREARAELRRLRRELAATRDERDRAHAQRNAAEEAAGVAQARLGGELAAAQAEQRRLRDRLADAEAALSAARRTGRAEADAERTRLWLLLDTLSRAAGGLRTELALPPPERLPADAVAADVAAAAGPSPAYPALPTRGRDVDDPAVLDELLRLPGVHLLVDGYNVTKTGFGGLPLAEQRARLLAGLAGLAAGRVEVTCVFDGAAVAPVPAPPAPRGVRVLFSDPGSTADELIRRLVRAEPAGRPLVVVSSDREVADGVRRSGAWAVPAGALLRRLGRG